MHSEKKSGSEAGAVAVEFALILPIFLVLVLGIFEFGRGFNIQVSLTEAAREAARYASIHQTDAGYNVTAAQDAGVAAAPSVPLQESNINVQSVGSNPCNVVVTVAYSTPWMTGFPGLVPGMPSQLSLQGKGVMRCGG
ncbi:MULTISPECIES: TadE/TadG family type IV pilus assembly protein [Arthrobacter]|uniref:Pilus assembly protein n=1 Tax=Arthrobacter terricola TaxID=2547396 RepID=A0A4R5L2L1_9MICC|nr:MULTISPECIES: TadE family protein [Arthrobacter]MBT8158997.1 pilus assembly protein [Arthrobacter sp. GN70]TDG01665.1 pilus assembly protein [Arthrobacter terricola]